MYPLVLEATPCVGARWGTADNAIAGGVGFWLSGKSPGDDGKIPEIRKTTRASPGLVTDRIINMREVFFEPNAEN